MSQAQPDRRRAPRAQADFPIQIAGKMAGQPAQLKDISEIGLCCNCRERIDEMTLLSIDLKLPGAQVQHKVKGAVVRCEPLPRGKGSFELAVYFTEIAPQTKAALKQLVAIGKPA